jgi:hypothetical protein
LFENVGGKLVVNVGGSSMDEIIVRTAWRTSKVLGVAMVADITDHGIWYVLFESVCGW